MRPANRPCSSHTAAPTGYTPASSARSCQRNTTRAACQRPAGRSMPAHCRKASFSAKAICAPARCLCKAVFSACKLASRASYRGTKRAASAASTRCTPAGKSTASRGSAAISSTSPAASTKSGQRRLRGCSAKINPLSRAIRTTSTPEYALRLPRILCYNVRATPHNSRLTA